jgi:hypothetical protein
VLVLLAGLLYSLLDLEARRNRRRHRKLVASFISHHGEDVFIKVEYSWHLLFIINPLFNRDHCYLRINRLLLD